MKSPLNPVRNLFLIFNVIIAFSISLKAQTNLGPFALQPRSANPLRAPLTFSTQPTPVAFDSDNDGDLDVAVAVYAGPGNGNPHFHYIENIGSATMPIFAEGHPNKNPFWLIPSSASFGLAPTPAFSDLDNDGDLDMLVGVESGQLNYYKNNGTSFLQYEIQTGATNPFDGMNVDEFASPAFFDLDNDGDDDVIIGSSYATLTQSIHYFVNNGDGSFSIGTLTGVNPAVNAATPALLDGDGDSMTDIVIGDQDGKLHFFKRVGATAFSEQTGSNNPFNTIDRGDHASPAAADFDHDGDTDLIVGSEKTNSVDIAYFENKGHGIFEEKLGFQNPFDGVTTNEQPSPVATDIDGDANVDLVVSNASPGAYTIRIFEKSGNQFIEQTGTQNQLSPIIVGANFVPSFADLDGDGDNDLLGGGSTSNGNDAIAYFKNNNGTYVRQNFATGPFADILIDDGKTDFVDIDADGDIDLFISVYDNNTNTSSIRYYKNTGTRAAAVYTEQIGTENIFHSVVEEYPLYPRFIDIDHDGDLDAIIGEGGGVIENDTGNEFSFYENTGNASTPAFTYRGDLIQAGLNPSDPSPAYVDFDNDGDLDFFVGSSNGTLDYYLNENPPPTVALNTATLQTPVNSLVVLDDQLLLADADNDQLVKATVSIQDFRSGKETLSVKSENGVIGSFDASTGILMLSGKANLAVWQSMLRTVTYQFTGDPNGRIQNLSRTVTVQVFDTDFTTSSIASRNLTVQTGNTTPNTAPVMTNVTSSIAFGGEVVIDLTTLISDVDGNVDLTTLTILQFPGSGATASINNSNQLVVRYDAVNFSGTETLRLQICDGAGACTQNMITIDVSENIITSNEIVIYNAVAPHHAADNKFMRILNLPQESMVTIFNRWGDVVFETTSYENTAEGNSFKGLNDHGRELTSGTYFYKIEFTDGRKPLTGYLSLIQ